MELLPTKELKPTAELFLTTELLFPKSIIVKSLVPHINHTQIFTFQDEGSICGIDTLSEGYVGIARESYLKF